MSEHTPGPWVIRTLRWSKEVMEINAKESYYPVAKTRDVTGGRYRTTPEINVANARLIAAAPDLLAALRALKHGDGCYCDAAFAMPDTIVNHSEECKAALTAITKATGQDDEPRAGQASEQALPIEREKDDPFGLFR